MSIGLVGEKIGMSRIFTEDGHSVPVTVIEAVNHVSQIKTIENDSYSAIQVVAGSKQLNRVNQSIKGHLAKAGVEPGHLMKEFRLDDGEGCDLELGSKLTVDLFKVGQCVDARGISKGKGFAGVIKRHNFSMQDATHGNSLSHRAHGSTGQCQTPGRVRKGKKMAGRMGNALCTVQGLEVVKVELDKNLILVKGAVPGPTGGYIVVVPSAKNKKKREHS